MWPMLVTMARTYAPYVLWPVAAVIGFVGYNIENAVRGDKHTPVTPSVQEQRNERLLKESENKDLLKTGTLSAAIHKRPELFTTPRPSSVT